MLGGNADRNPSLPHPGAGPALIVAALVVLVAGLGWLGRDDPSPAPNRGFTPVAQGSNAPGGTIPASESASADARAPDRHRTDEADGETAADVPGADGLDRSDGAGTTTTAAGSASPSTEATVPDGGAATPPATTAPSTTPPRGDTTPPDATTPPVPGTGGGSGPPDEAPPAPPPTGTPTTTTTTTPPPDPPPDGGSANLVGDLLDGLLGMLL